MPDTTIAKKRRHRAGPPLGREFRRFAAESLEVRTADDGSDAITISGMPIVYNTAYSVRDMFGTFEETMLPGVASDVLRRGADVRFLFNHDGMPLARTTSGTLTLTDGTMGLGMVATLDARQSLANDLAVAIERGDVNQMSCGFCVGTDEWNDAGDQRSISKFSDLFDVSGVTYPASPTTNLELAYRSIISQPIESQARVRQLWVAVGKDFRDGGGLSAEHAAHLQTALDALHSTDDLDIASIVRAQAATATVEPPSVGDTAGEIQNSAQGTRTAPATADERRAASASYNDIQSALNTALQAEFGVDDADGWCDLWIQDNGDDWVVWRVYGDGKPGPGLWQSAYSIDTDMVVTFTGDPQQVVIETSYVPVDRAADPAAGPAAAPDPSLVALELEAEQLRLRGQRRHAA